MPHLRAPLALSALAVLVATPAMAYPTSVWNVPTAKVVAAGTLHLGDYAESFPSGKPYIDTCASFGLWPGLELGGLYGIGAAEAGFDAWFDPTAGAYQQFHGKVQLLGEGDWTPAIALGGLGLGSPQNKSDNFYYGVLTKDLGLGDFSLGTFTVGGYSINTVGATPEVGPMGGWSRTLFGPVSLALDYIHGSSNSYAGVSGYLGFQVADNTYVEVGYFHSVADANYDTRFVSVDIDIPTGLWAKGE